MAMEIALSFLIGGLVAVAIYLLTSPSYIRFLFGLIFLSNAFNLMIFVLGRLHQGNSPIIPFSETGEISKTLPNPVPQALVLTAIVISFGLMAYSLVLAYRIEHEEGTLDTDKIINRGSSCPQPEPARGIKS
jgi:multicomponent Na+:H+ antiporter subunit C